MLPYFEISDNFIIFSYPFFIGLAWAIAYKVSLRLKNKESIDFKYTKAFFVGNFLSSWLGAKIFYLITADTSHYENLTLSSSFWLGGGFVFYGGLITCLVFTFIFIKATKQSFTSLNFILPAVPLAHGVGRVGCFMAGCCYGSPTESLLSIHLHHANRHPVQIYESLFLFGLSYLIYKKRSLTLYLSVYAIFRFLIEFLRGDIIRGSYESLSSSQIISAFIIFLIIIKMSFDRFKTINQQ